MNEPFDFDEIGKRLALQSQARKREFNQWLDSQPQHRRHIDDRPTFACADETARCLLADIPHAPQIGIEDGIPRGSVDLQEVAQVRETATQTEDADAQFLHDRLSRCRPTRPLVT